MFTHPPYEFLLTPEDIPLDVVYEDSDLMVVNKPPGLGDPSTTISMARRVANFGEQLTLNPTERYVRGDNKGDLKLIRKGMKTLPVFGMIDRNIQESYEWLESN